jgi:hypothetical protein
VRRLLEARRRLEAQGCQRRLTAAALALWRPPEEETSYVDTTRNINVSLGRQDIKAANSSAQAGPAAEGPALPEVVPRLQPCAWQGTGLLLSQARASLARGRPEQAMAYIHQVPALLHMELSYEHSE